MKSRSAAMPCHKASGRAEAGRDKASAFPSRKKEGKKRRGHAMGLAGAIGTSRGKRGVEKGQ